jgi:hypothetical protein
MSTLCQIGRSLLTPETAVELKDLLLAVESSRFALYRRAAQLRRDYLDLTTGDYRPEFKKWWVENRLDDAFGKLPNFTKYAKAGDILIEQEQRNVDLRRLPTAVSTLYELRNLDPDKLAELSNDPNFSRLTASAAKRLSPSFPVENEITALKPIVLGSLLFSSDKDDGPETVSQIIFGINMLVSSYPGLRFQKRQIG